MATIICPTVTAFDRGEFNRQMHVVKPFATRVHVDLMDGDFAPTVSPQLEDVWWPHELEADIHLMYRHPMDYLSQLIALRPRMVIIHNEADVHHMHFAAELHRADIEVGLAILHDTPIEYAEQIMHSFDQILIFSGDLGHHGGHADMAMLDKVAYVRHHHPDAEIAWDGGINADNARQLADAGVDVLNVGGFIQKADDPAAAYAKLESILS